MPEETILSTAAQADTTQQAQQTSQTTQQTITTETAAQRPAFVPEKFWNAEKGAADIEKLGSAYVSLEQAFSKKGNLAAPLPGDPPEKVEAFQAELRKLTGAPDKPEGYEIKAPEKMPDGIKWDEEGAGKLAAIGVKHSIPKAAIADILALQQERMGLVADGAKVSMEQRMEAGKAELQGEWKENFKANAEAAVKAAKLLGVDMNDPELGNSPKVIKAMYQASLLMREDKIIGSENSSSKSNAELIEEIRRSDAYNGKLGRESQTQAANRMAALYGVKA